MFKGERKTEKEELEWYFKKDKEYIFTSKETDKIRAIEKKFIEEQLGKDKIAEIYKDIMDYGINPDYKCNLYKVLLILRSFLLKKVMREYLNEI